MNNNGMPYDYNKAIDKAVSLEETAEKLERLISRELDETVKVLKAGLEGEAALMYLDKLSRVKDGFSEDVKKIRLTAENIRIKAKKQCN